MQTEVGSLTLIKSVSLISVDSEMSRGATEAAMFKVVCVVKELMFSSCRLESKRLKRI